jgi:hypothetical protein
MRLPDLGCWGCPVALSLAMVFVLVGLVLAGSAAMLWPSRSRVLRSVAVTLASLGGAWYLLVSLAIWRFGVQWASGPPSRVVRADVGLALAWYVVSAVVVGLLWSHREGHGA